MSADDSVAVSGRLVRNRILSFVVTTVQKTSDRAGLRVDVVSPEVLEITGNPTSVNQDTALLTLGI